MGKADLIKGLYLKNLSGPEISRRLKVNIRWVYRCLERQNIPRRSVAVQNKIRFENSPLSFRFKENLSPSERELLIAGVMLYYGEGAKTGTTVDFANSDSLALRIFLMFLRKICRVKESKLRFYLYCFSNQDPYLLVNYWANLLNVSPNNFTKPYVRKNNPKLTRVTAYGVLHVRYSDVRLLKIILSLNNEIGQKLLKLKSGV